MTVLTLRSIGLVRNDVSEGGDENWGEVLSRIVVEPEFAPGLQGLEGFSHALVVVFLHKASFSAASDLIRRPRGLASMPEIGIFAQRAKHRPNPIGITAVAIEQARQGNVLTVRGLDAIDGTPVLDLKPYVPAFDRREAEIPGWMDELMAGYF